MHQVYDSTNTHCLQSAIGNVSLSILHLGSKYLLDYFRICFFPAPEILNRKRHLNVSEFFVLFVEGIIRDRIKMKLDKSLLRFIAPKILHESIHQRSLGRGHVFVDHNCRMLTENGGPWHNNLER